ncbi:MAG: tRNA pseudouridine(55) synthase TruB [Eubacterium sp.]|nr:tRNA pseudouridine(55) synthase TruB [Eubacterium sp.]
MINGVINIYKETGYTSHDVVARLRGILHQKKIGHTGTLDPDAVGVLPVCLGKATRLAEKIASGGKEYEAVLLLGKTTDTQDISGTVIREACVSCSESDIRGILPAFLGEQLQVPPMYSAKHVDGKRLYELARKGMTVERKPAKIRIDRLEMKECSLPRVTLRISCSKGTYIRTLCQDIGERLGCGGCMEHLIRTRAGMFRVEEAITLSEAENLAQEGKLAQRIRPIDSFFEKLPAYITTEKGEAQARNGNGIAPVLLRPAGCFCSGIENKEFLHADSPDTAKNEIFPEASEKPESLFQGQDFTDKRIRIYDSEKEFLGVYSFREDLRMFFPELFVYDAEKN